MRAIALVLASLLLIAGCTTTAHPVRDPYLDASKADIVLVVLREGLAGNEDIINRFVAEDYKQHNPMAEDGRAGLLAFVRSLKGVPFKIEVARVLTDGDYVAVHSDVWFGESHSAVFDLFIVRDGMLREHWDCIQAVPEPEKLSGGRSMMNGPTEISDRDRTEANRALIKEYQAAVLARGDQEVIDRFFGEPWFDHNEELWLNHECSNVKAHRIVAEGNFVLTQWECTIDGKPHALYTLFRIENGKIVEQWGTRQEIPATSKNKNGMF